MGAPQSPANGHTEAPDQSKESIASNIPQGCIWEQEEYLVSEEEWKLRGDLAAAYRLCHRMGLNEGVCNHLTVLLPSSRDRFLLIAYGLLWSEVTAGNLLTVQATTEGRCKVLIGTGLPETTAFWIHSRIHLARPQAAAVVFHTHSVWTTPLCCLDDARLPMIHQNCLRYYGDIAYDPLYPGLVEDMTEGDRLAAAMGDSRVLLHANHGIIVTAPTIWQAWDDLYYLERAAEVVVKTRSMNMPIRHIPPEVCRKFKDGFDATGEDAAWQYFHALKRELRDSKDRAFEQHDNVLPIDVRPGARQQTAPKSLEF